jgi:hypothetical protein
MEAHGVKPDRTANRRISQITAVAIQLPLTL